MELVKEITSDHELLQLADIIRVRVDGVFTLEEIKKPLPKGSYLILLRDGQDVGHWVAQYNDEYFDSTGIGPPTKFGNLKFNEFQYQGTYASFCGIWSLLWLYTKQHNKPELLEGFRNLNINVLS